jgi:ATP-dependent helicase HrpB
VLELAVVSRASADQRAGRAGRLAPGRALRLWSPAARLEERTPPEIHRADLMELVLASASAGIRAGTLSFPDPPRPYALEDAERKLLGLEAIDDSRAITDTGREMMGLGLDPPLARVLVEARRRGDAGLLQDVVDLVASLSAGRGIVLPADGRDPPPGRDEISEPGCDFVARILAMRRGEPGRHGLRAGPLAEAREVARRLRLALELDGTDRGPSSRRGLARMVVRAWPESAYVPHARSGAFGNGRDEVVLGRESFAPPGARALVVLEKRSLKRGRGRTVTMATCASPVDLDVLVELGVGEESLVDARLEDGILVAVLERRYAGRAIGTAEAEPGPGRAAEAAAVVVWGSRILPGAAGRLRDDVQAWNLSIALGRTRGDPVDPRAWLEDRLRTLGVRSGADLDLVGADDLVFDGLDEQERTLLDREFPRRIHLGEQEIGVAYEVDARQAILTHLSGARRTPPPSRLLPPWPGWGVVYRDRGRSTRIR